MSGVNEIRRTFLTYFEKNGHEIVASGPLVPRNDPTLMFVNAGMVPFKNLFTGLETRDYVRATSSQKCVRAGGKHNDLDNVGYTARHHTFFEMLGNFSFGDYFKENAIELAWTLITKEFGLSKERLSVTVYHEDDEAFDLWKKIAGLPDERIIRIATSDNFWAMGDTGPCGPCSEIFFDHGDHIWGGPPGTPEEDGDRFIEIWNLVFMQFEQTETERLNLPRPSIDTGMGLERIAAVLQGVHDNYDIDLFSALIGACENLTQIAADNERGTSHRVIADHLRSMSFLIADGVLPSNDGRGYVLRRIMRRAMRHAHLLGAQDPVIYKLVPTLTREMAEAFPELNRAKDLITETIEQEERRFARTLARGLSLLDDATGGLQEGDILPGATAFKLYDTFGFPLDLTEDALKGRKITVDVDGFNAAMAKQKADARASWTGSGEAADDRIWFQLREELGPTEFLGYDTQQAEGVLLAIVKDGVRLETLQSGETAALIVNQTPFYGESGGQQGDQGLILAGGIRFIVDETQKKADGLFVHIGRLETGMLAVSAALDLQVNRKRRAGLCSNHSATHLIYEALRQVLGTHVAQKGSLVSPDRLRFDISHTKPISEAEMAQIEEIANSIVLQNAPVSTRLMAVDDAIEAGAMALFGEKYGDEVRVVQMGRASDGSRASTPFSLELCGGTHVARTGDIGLITVIGQSAVAAGVRRVEALTADAARAYLTEQDRRVKEMAVKLRTTPADILERVDTLLDDRKKLERQLAEARKELARGGGVGGAAADPVKDINGIKVVSRIASGIPAKELKGLVDAGKNDIGSGIVVMIATGDDGKAGVVVGVTDDLSSEISAVDLVRSASAALGGKGGGGRPDMAQAGGPDGAKAPDAIAAIEALIAKSPI